MILRLKTGEGYTITDTEVYKKRNSLGNWETEINSDVFCEPFGEFLLENQDRKKEIYYYFSEIENLREWLWEISGVNTNWTPEKHAKVEEYIKKFLMKVSEEFDLTLNED